VRLNGQVHHAPWRGHEADRFRRDWDSIYLPHLVSAAEFLHQARALLASNAAEQRAASQATGSTSNHASSDGARLASLLALDAARLAGLSASGGPPSATRTWWDSLSPSEQKALIAEHPEIVGNLDGVPPDARYEANRLNIQAHIDSLRSSGASEGEIGKFQALLSAGRHILVFDPAGDGRIAEVFGNLKTADDIAVVVPGIGTSLSNYSPGNAKNLYEAAGSDKGDTATIMWVGYDTPSGVEPSALTDPAMISAGRAQAWAGTLVSFTEGLRTSGNGEISIVAHSYGTVLATVAAQRGMIVERVILLGSPGVPADDATVFNGADVFAAKNTGDPVPLGNTHGTDPTWDRFGATSLPHNPVNWNPLTWLNPRNPHSTYFDDGSPALEGIVKAVESPRDGGDGMIVQRVVNEDGSADDIATGSF
jgi:hypothetical protein